MDTLSCASVEGLLTKIKNLASCPIVEFNKYEVLDLLEALKNTARDVRHEKEGYFRLVYETLRGKLDQPNQMFRSFLLPLLGDKDHEKILGIVTKVEKKQQTSTPFNANVSCQETKCPIVVTIVESLGISVPTVSKEGGNHADVRLRLLPKLRTIVNNIC